MALGALFLALSATYNVALDYLKKSDFLKLDKIHNGKHGTVRQQCYIKYGTSLQLLVG